MLDYRWIFLILSHIVAAPILTYYYLRSPYSHLRPSIVEMTLVSLLVSLVCLGSSVLLGGLMNGPEQWQMDSSFDGPSASP